MKFSKLFNNENISIYGLLLFISREKQRALRTIHTLEKRARDATTATDDDTQKLVHSYKEQV